MRSPPWTRDKESIGAWNVLRRLMELAKRRLNHLPDGSGVGMFLQNGARFYVDSGTSPGVHHTGMHQSLGCGAVHPGRRVHPRRPGHRTGTGEQGRSLETVVLRSNVDYGGTGSTWGCHESYLHLRDPQVFAAQIIPHLVSRIIYTGAGGFNSLHPFALNFTLSPRVWHLQHEISNESTHSRGIFHTKNESLSNRGYNRLHIICGESLCSELATWLKIGTTALVVALIDGGVLPGEAVRLRSPLAAIRRFASDPHSS